MINNYLKSSFLEKKAKFQIKKKLLYKSTKVIKLHSIKARAKADTKWQLENLRGKTYREKGLLGGAGGKNYESFSGRADSSHSNKT